MKLTKMVLVVTVVSILMPVQTMAASMNTKPIDPTEFKESPWHDQAIINVIPPPNKKPTDPVQFDPLPPRVPAVYDLEIKFYDFQRAVKSDSIGRSRRDGDSTILESRTAQLISRKTHVAVINPIDGLSRMFEFETFQLHLRADLKSRAAYRQFEECVDKATEALSDWDRILTVRVRGIRTDQIFVQPQQLVENYLRQEMQKNMKVRLDRSLSAWQSKTIPETLAPRAQKPNWENRFEQYDEIARQIVPRNSLAPDFSKVKIECEAVLR